MSGQGIFDAPLDRRKGGKMENPFNIFHSRPHRLGFQDAAASNANAVRDLEEVRQLSRAEVI
jgi:hypothetical protein